LYINPKTAVNFKQLDDSALVDLLAEYTDRYTQLFKEPVVSAEYEECKFILNDIIRELQNRGRISTSILPFPHTSKKQDQ